jgi:hypothetical protein
LKTFKKHIDSTISTAEGLEEGSSYREAYQALPYHESRTQLSE